MTIRHRDVAQLGSSLPWGGRGRQFKSDRSDHDQYSLSIRSFLFRLKLNLNTIVLSLISDKIITTLRNFIGANYEKFKKISFIERGLFDHDFSGL